MVKKLYHIIFCRSVFDMRHKSGSKKSIEISIWNKTDDETSNNSVYEFAYYSAVLV